jgi:hypothetical protein
LEANLRCSGDFGIRNSRFEGGKFFSWSSEGKEKLVIYAPKWKGIRDCQIDQELHDATLFYNLWPICQIVKRSILPDVFSGKKV